MFESRFQSFADVGGPSNGAARVAELRRALETAGVSGFIVPRADEHQNEYVPPSAERLLWLTGFSGSAGHRDRSEDQGGVVRRRAVHRAGQNADGPFSLRIAACGRPAAGRMDQPKYGAGRKARLRPATSYSRRRRTVIRRVQEGGSRAGRASREPDRLHLARPSATAIGNGDAAKGSLRRRKRGGQDRTRARGAEGRRWASDQRPAQSGVAVQHSRRRRRPYARAARIRLRAPRRASRRLPGLP